MKVCTHCRMEVPTAAGTCPYCLENPGDGFEVWNTIISIALLSFIGFVVFSVLFGSSNQLFKNFVS